MRGVSGQEKASMLHRLRDEAAHGRHAFLKDRTLVQAEPFAGLEPPLQLFPDAAVRPCGQVFVGPALQVNAAELRRAHAQQGEASFVVRIDQLPGCRRRSGENAQPAKSVDLLVTTERRGGNGGAAKPMGTVASTDEIADNLQGAFGMLKSEARRLSLNIMDFDLAGIEEYLCASLDPGANQILDEFVLAIHGDAAAAREFVHIDAMAAAIEPKFDTAMNQAFAPHAFPEARFIEQIHRALFENARTEPFLDVFAGAGFDDNRVDAFEVQQVGEDEASRSGSDNADPRAEFRNCRHGYVRFSRSASSSVAI